MDRLERLEQVVKSQNEAIKELLADVKALKGGVNPPTFGERFKALNQETLINHSDMIKSLQRIKLIKETV